MKELCVNYKCEPVHRRREERQAVNTSVLPASNLKGPLAREGLGCRLKHNPKALLSKLRRERKYEVEIRKKKVARS